MTRARAGSEPMAGEDFDDVEWELLCSARETTVGLVPVPVEQLTPVLPMLGRTRPWKHQ